MEAPDPASFRRALSCFTTGVTVISVRAPDGEVCGMTANSFTSVSLSPPTILVSLMQGRTLKAIKASGRFVVNVLGQDAENISSHFAGKPIAGWRPAFAGAPEYPALTEALAVFSCNVLSEHRVNDHTLLIASVEDCHADQADPLVFFGSRYRRLSA